MISASQIRAGMAIRYQNQPYRVIVADYHPGQEKMGGVNHLRLKNPDFVEVRVANTAPPSHGQVDSTWKPARLTNDVEIMVPPFVKSGDTIRLSLSDMKYMDHAKAKSS